MCGDSSNKKELTNSNAADSAGDYIKRRSSIKKRAKIFESKLQAEDQPDQISLVDNSSPKCHHIEGWASYSTHKDTEDSNHIQRDIDNKEVSVCLKIKCSS